MLLQKIAVTENTLMVTVDIESLYTNIQHKDALEAIQWAWSKESKIKKSQIEFVIKGLELAMGNNYFWAKDHYL